MPPTRTWICRIVLLGFVCCLGSLVPAPSTSFGEDNDATVKALREKLDKYYTPPAESL